MKTLRIPLLLVPLMALACTQSAEVGQLEHTNAPTGELDVLFVIDNSGSMSEEQASLAANLQTMVDQLQTLPGGLPDIHVAVVSTDLGAGGYPLSGCVGDGDDGAFHNAPQAPGCSTPSEGFISNEILPDGSRDPNYPGTLAETFQCIAQIGIDGCGFEQPLESMRRAILNSEAAGDGFLRPGAHLAVVILADEDDCSASDTELFNSNQDSISDPLGPMSSFRCVEFGLTCDGGDITRTANTYSSCEPKASSPYLYDTVEFVDFLTTHKGGNDNIIVSVIAGDRTALEVTLDGVTGNPTAQPTCSSANGVAFGGYRLGAFAEAFPNHLFTSLCNPDLTGALQATGTLIANVLDDSQTGDPDPTPDPPTEDQPAGCNTSTTPGPLLALLALLFLYRRRRGSRGQAPL